MSNGIKNWALRLFALSIAIGSWITVSFVPRLQEKSEPLVQRDLPARVSYQVPEGYMVLNRENAVEVRVRGRAELVNSLTESDVNVQVPFPMPPDLDAPNEVTLRPQNVTVPEGIEVVALEPGSLSLKIDERERRNVPVLADLRGEPSAGARLQDFSVEPPEVLVEGPKKVLETLDGVRTEQIPLDQHAFSFTRMVEVLSDQPNVKVIEPTLVSLRVEIIPPEDPGTSSAGRGR